MLKVDLSDLTLKVNMKSKWTPSALSFIVHYLGYMETFLGGNYQMLLLAPPLK